MAALHHDDALRALKTAEDGVRTAEAEYWRLRRHAQDLIAEANERVYAARQNLAAIEAHRE